jgi:hypothetical protein
MSYLTSARSRSSASSLKMASWGSSFPVVTKLWRELLREFAGSYRPELDCMRPHERSGLQN